MMSSVHLPKVFFAPQLHAIKFGVNRIANPTAAMLIHKANEAFSFPIKEHIALINSPIAAIPPLIQYETGFKNNTENDKAGHCSLIPKSKMSPIRVCRIDSTPKIMLTFTIENDRNILHSPFLLAT
jgi:hypothetical protein